MKDSETKRSILFSIIVPVYEVEKYLSRCIDSILSQTYSNFELILVDDGSQDGCPRICDEYAGMDSRIRVIHKENGGLSSARNAGMRVATGDYIMFVDSDDYWSGTSSLQSVTDAVERFQCDVLCMNYSKVYDHSSAVERYFSASAPYVGLVQVLENERYISSACVKTVRTSVLKDGDMEFVENVCSEDIDWSLRLLLKAKSIVYVDLAFYCYFQRDGSISRSMNLRKIQDLKQNVVKCIELLRAQDVPMQRLLNPYVSYQYAILLLNIAAISDKSRRNEMLEGLEQESDLLQFSSSSKVRMMNLSSKVLGFNGLMRLLSIFVRLKK